MSEPTQAVEVWGSGMCPDCRVFAEAARAAGFDVTEYSAVDLMGAAEDGRYDELGEVEREIALAIAAQGMVFPVAVVRDEAGVWQVLGHEQAKRLIEEGI